MLYANRVKLLLVVVLLILLLWQVLQTCQGVDLEFGS